jgi:adenylate cyclase
MFVVTTMYKYLSEERERKKVKGAFGLYLAPEVIDQVLTDPNALKPGGEKKELTVFFSDVRSFTTISESLSPEKLCELMNDYFTPMADIILRTRGVLDKYIGDAIMAFWGAPIPQPNHADVACMAAIEMLFALDKLRVDLAKKGFPAIEIGIGLNTGLMSVGNMGSPQRFCYTVMGDAVNLGSRLEGATKDYGIKIMISESTHKKLTNKSLFTRDLDDIRVKGKMEPVKVFELMRPDMLRNEAAMQNIIGEFHAGRAAYRAQDWAKARKHFLACLILRPEDGPAAMYLERIKDREQEPFVEAWDGVYTRKHK